MSIDRLIQDIDQRSSLDTVVRSLIDEYERLEPKEAEFEYSGNRYMAGVYRGEQSGIAHAIACVVGAYDLPTGPREGGVSAWIPALREWLGRD